MKKIVFNILMLMIYSSTFAQPTIKPAPAIETDYLKKSKHQKTIGFILLGGGAAFFFGSWLIVSGIDKGGEGTGLIVLGSMTVGMLAMPGSIPFFIASSRNKRKAANASAGIKIESASLVHRRSFSTQSYPVIALKICL